MHMEDNQSPIGDDAKEIGDNRFVHPVAGDNDSIEKPITGKNQGDTETDQKDTQYMFSGAIQSPNGEDEVTIHTDEVEVLFTEFSEWFCTNIAPTRNPVTVMETLLELSDDNTESDSR